MGKALLRDLSDLLHDIDLRGSHRWQTKEPLMILDYSSFDGVLDFFFLKRSCSMNLSLELFTFPGDSLGFCEYHVQLHFFFYF